jgi:hypothetical protein
MKAKGFLVAAGVAALSGCGRQAELTPAPGHKMPVKPEMARAAPTVNELLKAPTYARPDRVDELVKKSQPRPADPFDLPPPTGGAAPSQPAGTDPGAVTNNTSVSNPGD